MASFCLRGLPHASYMVRSHGEDAEGLKKGDYRLVNLLPPEMLSRQHSQL